MSADFNPTFNDAALTGRLNHLDTGGANAKIQIYNGTRPSPGGSATTLLVELILANPAGSIVSHILSLAQLNPYDIAVATGTATWGRLITAGGVWCVDADVGIAGSGQPIIIDVSSISSGGRVTLVSADLGY